jgi:phospholipase C
MKNLLKGSAAAALPLLALGAGIAPFTCTPQACSIQLPDDTLAGKRSSCAFGKGALTQDTLGIPPSLAAQIPIRHVIIVMKENRSYDHLLGRLHDLGQPAASAVPPSYSNPDLQGTQVFPYHADTSCLDHDPGHQAASVAEALAGGAMTGFVQAAAQATGTDGHFVMTFYEDTDLPFYFWLANTYALSDSHFAPMASGTYGNRDFMMFGTNAGVVDTGISYPDPSTPSIFRTLMAGSGGTRFTWASYTDGSPMSGALGWDATTPGVHSLQDLYDALDQGTLPNVAFVDGLDNIEDDHPWADLQLGEQFVHKIYDHAINSPQWSRLAIIWTYDEAGGFADHVTPPSACQADPSSPFTAMGPRVPLVVISRWAKPHYVSHVPHDHTAITRFIELLFGLPALTARDANSDALLDLFDFSCSQPERPQVAAPPSGSRECANPPQPGYNPDP